MFSILCTYLKFSLFHRKRFYKIPVRINTKWIRLFTNSEEWWYIHNFILKIFILFFWHPCYLLLLSFSFYSSHVDIISWSWRFHDVLPVTVLEAPTVDVVRETWVFGHSVDPRREWRLGRPRRGAQRTGGPWSLRSTPYKKSITSVWCPTVYLYVLRRIPDPSLDRWQLRWKE